MKKKLLLVLLALALLLPGCGGRSEYKILNGARLKDCTLTVYYDDASIYRLLPCRLIDFYNSDEEPGIYRVMIPGTELKKNEQFLSLLEMLDGQELPPKQYVTEYWEEIRPTVYYVLTDKNGGKIFDLGMGWPNCHDTDADSHETTVNFNGEKIPYHELYYTCMYPYLTNPHYLPGVPRLWARPTLDVNDCVIEDPHVHVIDRGYYFARLPLLKILEAIGVPVEWPEEHVARFVVGEQEYILSITDQTLQKAGSGESAIVPGEGLPDCYLSDVYYYMDTEPVRYSNELFLDNYCLLATLDRMGIRLDIDWDRDDDVITVREGGGQGNLNTPFKSR